MVKYEIKAEIEIRMKPNKGFEIANLAEIEILAEI